ncbi:tyrosine-type recombinase/integrase [Parvularcula dongshanensis]|uniref:Integrase n=1 Tax=Parvularcula dongshanensis TaxID=1173995 RepID=A0A840I4P0_9PROT|nr:tyrosine-type recombinase/integrase [Parvularcula dongshanensis]MBB4659322.1 integrase [Parvularcula dongshanensis]
MSLSNAALTVPSTATGPIKLTEAFVATLRPNGRRYVVRDTEVKGFLVAVNQRGMSYKVQKDLWVGEKGNRKLAKTVRRTLGEVSVREARRRALAALSEIGAGVDPNGTYDPDGAKAESAGGWTVGRMFEEYAADMRVRDLASRTVVDHMKRLDAYLPDWKDRPIASVKRSECRARHALIAERHGKTTANRVLGDFRSSYNFALKVCDEADELPGNPVTAVSFYRERASGKVILPDDLPAWWTATERLTNPTRRLMHRFGLLSGLRPGTLMSLERSWYKRDERAVVIPKMKSGRSFSLPLSEQMVALLDDAGRAADLFATGSPYFFPTRGRDGAIKPTAVVKEKSMPGQTGHILRHTHRTIAQRAGLDSITARLLLDHTVPGIDGVYVHERALFDRLLEAQETATESISRLCAS